MGGGGQGGRGPLQAGLSSLQQQQLAVVECLQYVPVQPAEGVAERGSSVTAQRAEASCSPICNAPQVAAYTSGRSRVAEYDCLLLRHILWQRPDESERIYDWLLRWGGMLGRNNSEALAL